MPESGSLLEITIDDIRSSLEQNVFTSVDLVRACIARIDETKELNAILQVNEDAIRIAEELDSERLSGRVRGYRKQLPYVINDKLNIDLTVHFMASRS
jgi:amidase